MGDTDQLSRPLTDGLAIQVSDAVFRYNVVDMVAAGDHARPGFEHAGDPSDGRSIFQHGRAWKSNDGDTTF